MMKQFKIGCNFDEDLIKISDDLNKEYEGKSKIVEMYGSDRNHGVLAGRPNWRLQDISLDFLESYVKKCLDKDITFNYTMNSIFPYMRKSDLYDHKKEIQDFVKHLESIGVYRITVASPILALIIREVSNIELELSTIAHVDTVTQLKYYHETFGINKICGSILKNRNKEFLKKAAGYCKENGVIYELMVNEMCGVGGEGYATHCAYRDSCYICHAMTVTKEENLLFDNYPMKFCMGSRNGNEESWLKMRWVRPEDLHYYEDLGLNHFKLTGRTGSTEYLAKVAKAYMSESYEGNLIGLWKPLETIYNGKSEKEESLQDCIDNKKLDGFLDHWFDGKGFECENELCGTTCNYCRDFYIKKLK